jgi:hypothetical protein
MRFASGIGSPIEQDHIGIAQKFATRGCAQPRPALAKGM